MDATSEKVERRTRDLINDWKEQGHDATAILHSIESAVRDDTLIGAISQTIAQQAAHGLLSRPYLAQCLAYMSCHEFKGTRASYFVGSVKNFYIKLDKRIPWQRRA